MFDGALTVHLIQMLFGNLLMFVVMTFIVELCLKVFKICNPRLRVYCRCLPILKLPLGIFLYGIIDVNFFSCHSLLKPMFCNLFFTEMSFLDYTESKLSLPQYFASQAPQGILMGVFITFLVVSLGLILRSAYQNFFLLRHLKIACREAQKLTRSITNPALKNILEAYNVQLLTTDAFSVPVAAAGKNIILIPRKLVNVLSQAEFEAVIAHEWEHLRWKDPFVKFLCSSICQMFWWIPTKRWLDRIEDEQEHACDRDIHHFGYEGTLLASALVKVLRQGKKEKFVLCQFTSRKDHVLMRVQRMVQTKSFNFSKWSYIGLGIVCLACVLIGYRIC